MTFLLSTVRGSSPTIHFCRRTSPNSSSVIGIVLGHVTHVLCGMGRRATRHRGCCRLVVSFMRANVIMLGDGNSICRGGGRTVGLLKLSILARIGRLSHVSSRLVATLRGTIPNSGLRVRFGARQKAIRLTLQISNVHVGSRRLHVVTLDSVGQRLSRQRVSS